METQPIFIIGSPRSGTTLVRVILDSHPNICCGPETHLIKTLQILHADIEKKWHMLKPYGSSHEKINKKISNILEAFTGEYKKQKNKARWAEKTPDNIFRAEFINTIFPSCQFINVIRDGRDVVCSYKKRWGRLTLFKAISTWNKAIELTYHYRTLFPKDRYLEVYYEELVSNPEKITKEIMIFLNEKWTKDLLSHQKAKHDYWFNKENGEKSLELKEKQPKRHSPSKPIFTSSSGKWKKELNLYEKSIVNLLMKDNLKNLGYK
jgi:hypothetical protein